MLKRSQVTDVWCFARPQLGIARAEMALRNAPAAIVILEQTLAVLDRDDPTSMFLADACFELAEALAVLGRDEARVKSLAQRALELYRKVDYLRKDQLAAAERFVSQRPPNR